MSSLQLKTFFALSKYEKELLPPVLFNSLLDKCASVIQTGWKSTWVYKKNTIVNVMNTTFTSYFCQKYIYEEAFNKDVNIENLFYFFHNFFKNYEPCTIDDSTLHKLMSIITREAKMDSHAIFCILYGIIQYPDSVTIQWKIFREILCLFPNDINNEMLRFCLP